MYDRQELLDRLKDVLEALERIPRRSESIHSADDFLVDEAGLEHLDSICMLLVAVGELSADGRKNERGLAGPYPIIPWRDVIGVRNVIAHGYFDLDAEQVFTICKEDIPELIGTVRVMIKDLQEGAAF